MKASEMDDVLDQLLRELSKTYHETGTVSESLLSALQFVVETPLQQALDLVDHKAVSVLTSPSGRQVYQVIGSSGTPYTCFTSTDYCGCPAFRYAVLRKAEHSLCKHLLAIKLSVAMATCHQQDITDEQLTEIIINMD